MKGVLIWLRRNWRVIFLPHLEAIKWRRRAEALQEEVELLNLDLDGAYRHLEREREKGKALEREYKNLKFDYDFLAGEYEREKQKRRELEKRYW